MYIEYYDPIYEREKHPYHLLPNSPLPFLTCLFLLATLFLLVLNLHNIPPLVFSFISRDFLLHLSFAYLWATLYAWFNSITRESMVGHHTVAVQSSLKLGFVLFIFSEVMLFFAFFWSFFHFSLVPAVTIGDVWPPFHSQILEVWRLPFINTVLLLASGYAITQAHKELMDPEDGWQEYWNVIFRYNLACTLIFGFTFLFVQGLEYKYGVQFSWRSNIYGSIFFLTTGFHGMHVTVGAIFLLYCYARQQISEGLAWYYLEGCVHFDRFGSRRVMFMWDCLPAFRLLGFSTIQHVGFETAAWYWHFVDIVWLFLFVTVYWWGGATELAPV